MKSANWFILNRTHSNIYVDDDNLIDKFSVTHCPEKYYFITVLKINDCLKDIIVNSNMENQTTFYNLLGSTDYKYYIEYDLSYKEVLKIITQYQLMNYYI